MGFWGLEKKEERDLHLGLGARGERSFIYSLSRQGCMSRQGVSTPTSSTSILSATTASSASTEEARLRRDAPGLGLWPWLLALPARAVFPEQGSALNTVQHPGTPFEETGGSLRVPQLLASCSCRKKIQPCPFAALTQGDELQLSHALARAHLLSHQPKQGLQGSHLPGHEEDETCGSTVTEAAFMCPYLSTHYKNKSKRQREACSKHVPAAA